MASWRAYEKKKLSLIAPDIFNELSEIMVELTPGERDSSAGAAGSA